MSAHPRGAGSPSVRQLIARYQSMDSPSSRSSRPTATSTRPAETHSPKHDRPRFASRQLVPSHEVVKRLQLEAIKDVFYGSDGSATAIVAQTPLSPSHSVISNSSDSDSGEDISTGFRLFRDKVPSPPERNISKPGNWFVPRDVQEGAEDSTGHLLQVSPATPPSISRTSSFPRIDIDDNDTNPGSFFRDQDFTAPLSTSLPEQANTKVNAVDATPDFLHLFQQLPPTPPHDDSGPISLSSRTNTVSTQGLSFLPTRSSTPPQKHQGSTHDHPVRERYIAAAKRAITLESRLPSRRISTPFPPTQTQTSSYSPESDASFPYVSDTSTPYDGVWRLKNLLRGPRRTAPPNTPSASSVRRFLQRRAEQQLRSPSPSYQQDRDDSLVSEAGRGGPSGRLETRDSHHSHHLAARIAETSILTYSHVSFQTDFSPSPFPLRRKFSSFSFRERDMTTGSLPAPLALAELSIPWIRLQELDESFVASLERSLVLEMETSEMLGGQQGLAQALETLWEYGSEASEDDRWEEDESLEEEALS